MKLIEPPWAFLVMNSVIPLGRTSRMTVAPDGPLELATTPAFANVFAPVSYTTRATTLPSAESVVQTTR